MTTFLFLRVTHDLLELPRIAVTRGEPRIRPFVSTSVPVLPCLRKACPTAIPNRPRHLRRLTPLEFSAD